MHSLSFNGTSFALPSYPTLTFLSVFSIVLGSTIKSQHRQVKRLRLLVNNDSLSDALLRYINAGHLREVTRDTASTLLRLMSTRSRDVAETGGEEVIITILRDEGDGELLATVQSWLEAGDESWWRLKELLRAYVVKRDLEQVLQVRPSLSPPRSRSRSRWNPILPSSSMRPSGSSTRPSTRSRTLRTSLHDWATTKPSSTICSTSASRRNTVSSIVHEMGALTRYSTE